MRCSFNQIEFLLMGKKVVQIESGFRKSETEAKSEWMGYLRMLQIHRMFEIHQDG